MSEPYTPTQAANVVACVDGVRISNPEAWVRAVVRNPGASVVSVDMTLTDVDDDHETKFKITIERTSAP